MAFIVIEYTHIVFQKIYSLVIIIVLFILTKFFVLMIYSDASARKMMFITIAL